MLTFLYIGTYINALMQFSKSSRYDFTNCYRFASKQQFYDFSIIGCIYLDFICILSIIIITTFSWYQIRTIATAYCGILSSIYKEYCLEGLQLKCSFYHRIKARSKISTIKMINLTSKALTIMKTTNLNLRTVKNKFIDNISNCDHCQ